MRLLVIADDLTGGLDTGVQFASCGLKTRLITENYQEVFQQSSHDMVLIVDAETRRMEEKEARSTESGRVLICRSYRNIRTENQNKKLYNDADLS